MHVSNLTELSVVIPVYSRGEYLSELHSRLKSVMESNSIRFEIIYVDDCGFLESWPVIKQIAQNHSNVKGIRLTKNFGQHNATLCGIRHASYQVIATLDDDLQHPPEEIIAMSITLPKMADLGRTKQNESSFF